MLATSRSLWATFRALHPRILSPRENEAEIRRASEFLEAAIRAADDLNKAAAKINENDDLTNDGKMRQIAKAVELHMTPVLEAASKVREQIQARIKTVKGIIAELPELTEAELALGREIREYVRTLPSGERISLLRAAQEAEDMLTVRSLLYGPAFLTGLPAELLKKAQADLSDTVSPSETKIRERLEETQQIVDAVDRATRTAINEYKVASPEPLAA